MRNALRTVAVLAVSTLAACNDDLLERCTRAEDCAKYGRSAYCHAEGYCVVHSDGGIGNSGGGSATGGGAATGGGTATGGGVATGGGMGGGGGMAVGGGVATGGGMGGGGAGGGMALSCDAGCLGTEHCRVDAGPPAVCAPSFASLTWVAPAAGLTFDGGATVRVEAVLAQVVGAPAATFPPTLPLLGVDAGSLSPVDGGLYRLDVNPAAFGAVDAATLEVRFDAGSYSLTTGTRQVSFDRVGPVLTVVLPAVPTYPSVDSGFVPNDPSGAAFRRDEVVTVQVTTTDTDLENSSVVLTATADGGSVAFTDGGSCGTGCRQFNVDLELVPFAAMRGQMAFSAAGRDLNGNGGSSASAVTMPVTRWRWSTQLAQSGALVASPALSSSGLVIAATSSGTPSGLIAVEPTGALRWVNTAGGAIQASPAVGRSSTSEFAFVQSAGGSGDLRAVYVADGGVHPQSCIAGNSSSPNVSLAVMANGTDSVLAVGLQGNPRLMGLDPVGPGCVFVAAPFLAKYPANIVVASNALVFPDNNGTLTKYAVSGTTFSSPSTIPSSSFGLGTFNGIAVMDGGQKIAGGSGPGIAKFFVLDLDGGSLGSTTGTELMSAPVVGKANDLFSVFRVTDNQLELRRYTQTGTMLAGPATLPWTADFGSSSPGAPSPALGAGGLIYAVSNNNRLLVATQSSLSTVYEAAIGTGFGSVQASPALDCNRSRTSTRTGTLYVATTNGHLISLIVDSAGLDTSAAWPKYQHDPGNTGNIASSKGCP